MQGMQEIFDRLTGDKLLEEDDHYHDDDDDDEEINEFDLESVQQL
jgi:hypothetical protein